MIINCFIAGIIHYYYYSNFRIINTDAQKRKVVLLFVGVICYYATFRRLSEFPRKKAQIAPILINIGCNLTCFGPVRSFDVLIQQKDRWGSHVLRVLSNISKKVGVVCPQGVQKLYFAPSPRTFL
jgi:hypothetical protein